VFDALITHRAAPVIIDGGFDVLEEIFMRTIPLGAITFAAPSLSTIGARADGSWRAYYGNKTIRPLLRA
jgi:hypothetical protein